MRTNEYGKITHAITHFVCVYVCVCIAHGFYDKKTTQIKKLIIYHQNWIKLYVQVINDNSKLTLKFIGQYKNVYYTLKIRIQKSDITHLFILISI